MIERQIDCAFASEVSEQSEKKQNYSEIKKILQMDGLKYISISRPNNKRGGRGSHYCEPGEIFL